MIIRQSFDLQIIILGKVFQEIISKGFNVMDTGIHKNGLVPSQITGRPHMGRISHSISVIRTESRHNPAKTICPIAGAKSLTITGTANNHEVFDFLNHVR